MPSLVLRFLDLESPQKSRDADESTLLGKTLTAAYSAAPAECHVPLFVGKGTRCRVIFQEAAGIEPVWFWEVALVVVDGPAVCMSVFEGGVCMSGTYVLPCTHVCLGIR